MDRVALLEATKEIKRGKECVVIGTIYKDMKLKPSVLDEYKTAVRSLSGVISSDFLKKVWGEGVAEWDDWWEVYQ